ncbi:alanine racemase [Rhodospirillales bacterium TMPK1]|uniref:Alanine racemase n=2 Tax=Roseiterribacter gracilis TaxID=2812848 RepID=A0A8S8X872_9PROT|nr:alanine racemase [Rhodospirillales bacterium TMPK1]
MKIEELATPTALLDRAKFQRNCDMMLARVRDLGVKLRPHMKTLKSIDAARVAIDPSHGGIAVATLDEASYFADAGISDIFYAVCITPDKLARAAEIAQRAPDLSLLVDDIATAEAIDAFGRANNRWFRVWIELDSGEHRTGLELGDPMLPVLAKFCDQSPAIELAGVATHGGHSYRCRTIEEIADVAEQERTTAVRAAGMIRALNIPCPGVSVGSTPTALHARSVDGVTEIRAGVYMAGDLFQASIHSGAQDDIALSVLATVISHKANRMMVDAGGLALSKDRSTERTQDRGYGLVVDLHGASLGESIVAGVHQEHGELRGAQLEQLRIGSKVRILPNHACMTAAAYDRLYVVDGDQVVDCWSRTNGW